MKKKRVVYISRNRNFLVRRRLFKRFRRRSSPRYMLQRGNGLELVSRSGEPSGTVKEIVDRVPFWFLVSLFVLVMVGIVVMFFIGLYLGFQRGVDTGMMLNEPAKNVEKIAPSFDACLPYSNATVNQAIVLALDRCKAYYNYSISQIPDFGTVYSSLLMSQVVPEGQRK